MEILFWILFPLTMALVFCVLFKGKEKEEKRLDKNGLFKIKTGSSFKCFFLICMALTLIAAVIALIFCIIDKNEIALSGKVALVAVILFFFSVGLIGYVYVKYFYLIITDNSIIQVKGFTKKEIPYEKVKFMSLPKASIDSLIAYDANYVPLFSADRSFVGVDKLIQTLKDKHVEEISKVTKKDISPDNFAYKKYAKNVKINNLKYVLLGFGLMLLAIFAMATPQIKPIDFSDKQMTATLQSYRKVGEDVLFLKFEEHDEEYRVNNVVYKALDEKIYSVISEGKIVELVLYNAKSKDISQIKIDGKIYLNKEDVMKLENKNVKIGEIITKVLLCLSVCLIVGGIALQIYQIADKKAVKNVI